MLVNQYTCIFTVILLEINLYLMFVLSDHKVSTNRAQPRVSVKRGGGKAASGAVRRLHQTSTNIHRNPRKTPQVGYSVTLDLVYLKK